MLYANAARRARAAASMDERSETLRREAMAWEEANHIADPARFAAMLVPGFDDYD
jgi:hypothetical protein